MKNLTDWHHIGSIYAIDNIVGKLYDQQTWDLHSQRRIIKWFMPEFAPSILRTHGRYIGFGSSNQKEVEI